MPYLCRIIVQLLVSSTENIDTMPRRNQGTRRARKSRRRRSGNVSVVGTTISTIADYVVTTKTLTLGQLIPDIGAQRDIVITSISCKMSHVGTTVCTGSSAQLSLVGAPWAPGSEGFVSQNYKPIKATGETTCSVVPLPASLVSQSPNRAGICLAIRMQSMLASSTSVLVYTRYRLLADNAFTQYA